MSNFNNYEYETLATDLIGDIFYSTASYRNKVATVRQYTEIVIRKILDIPPNKEISLGDEQITAQIKKLPNSKILKNAVNNLRSRGNKTTHTEYRGAISEEYFNNSINRLFDALSYLLIQYFIKYPFGSDGKILFSFSILPPIIRYKVLTFLYEQYPDNVYVIDKLALATVKACGEQTAMEWLDNNKTKLLQLSVVSDTNNIPCTPIDRIIEFYSPSDMYQLCSEKIAMIAKDIEKRGVLYSDFESALSYYKKIGHIDGESPQIKEFNDIMEFLYMGRQARNELRSQINGNTTALDILDQSN